MGQVRGASQVFPLPNGGGGGGAEKALASLKGGGAQKRGDAKSFGLAISSFCSPPPSPVPSNLIEF